MPKYNSEVMQVLHWYFNPRKVLKKHVKFGPTRTVLVPTKPYRRDVSEVWFVAILDYPSRCVAWYDSNLSEVQLMPQYYYATN